MKKKLLLFLSILALIMPVVVFAEPESSASPTPSPSTTPEITITLSSSSIELKEGEIKTLTATISDTSKTVTWSSDDTNVATVENGKVTANKAGTATITAKVDDKTATCKVTVKANAVNKDVDLTIKGVSIVGADITKTGDEWYKVSVKAGEEAKFAAAIKDLEKNLKITLKDENAKLVYGSVSNDKFTIVLTDGADKKQPYYFVIKYPDANANLSKLEVAGYAFNEKFDKDTTSYTVTIPYDVTTVTINAIVEDDNAKVNPASSFTKDDLEVGSSTKNTVTIKVTNGNSTKTYKIFITRSEESKIEENKTSIITSKITSSDFNVPDTENPDSLLNYIIITLGTLVLFAIGFIGIYFYIKTSPKKMKKELMKAKAKKEESPIVEAKPEVKKSDIEEL